MLSSLDSCPLCRENPVSQSLLCLKCFSDISFIQEPGAESIRLHDWRDGPNAVSLFLYSKAAMKLVNDLKTSECSSIFGKIAKLMLSRFQEYISDRDCVLFVPRYWLDIMMRGPGPQALLAEKLSQVARLRLAAGLLRKEKFTALQKGKTAARRKSNLAGAFKASAELAGLRVLLIDDVITTGSTILACRSALRKVGCCDVKCLTLASTERLL